MVNLERTIADYLSIEEVEEVEEEERIKGMSLSLRFLSIVVVSFPISCEEHSLY